jgi:hypothetical protein
MPFHSDAPHGTIDPKPLKLNHVNMRALGEALLPKTRRTRLFRGVRHLSRLDLKFMTYDN